MPDYNDHNGARPRGVVMLRLRLVHVAVQCGQRTGDRRRIDYLELRKVVETSVMLKQQPFRCQWRNMGNTKLGSLLASLIRSSWQQMIVMGNLKTGVKFVLNTYKKCTTAT